jgi:hypothetical protein
VHGTLPPTAEANQCCQIDQNANKMQVLFISNLKKKNFCFFLLLTSEFRNVIFA